MPARRTTSTADASPIARALLKDGDPIPAGFQGAAVERPDRLFRGVRQGPSLGLVVAGSDEDAMVRHGYWVAGLRKRL